MRGCGRRCAGERRRTRVKLAAVPFEFVPMPSLPRMPQRAAIFVLLLLTPALALAATPAAVDLTAHWAGYAAMAIFALAYVFVIAEEFTGLRKSQPVMLAA